MKPNVLIKVENSESKSQNIIWRYVSMALGL
jgi:hypothetical protein